MTDQLVAGIDLGGTKTKLGLVSASGKIQWRGQLVTGNYEDPAAFVEAVSEMLEAAAQQLQVRLGGVGIGAPNGNPFTGTIAFAPNLKWKGTVPIVELFQQRLRLPVFLTNDAKAAALGEKFFGRASALQDFIVITLGTGLGSGIFSGGRLVYGHDGFAGELGHIVIRPASNRRCGCGRRGCLETYVSNKGLVQTYHELIENVSQAERPVHAIDDAADVYARAKQGFAPAISAFAELGTLLGEGLAIAVLLLRPASIFLTGGLAQAAPYFLPFAQQALDDHVLEIFKGKVSVTVSELPPADIGVLGAASLLLKQQPGIETI
ncbi:MAG: ROK family protein [Chitinophagales bacterium]|nr:ROK family protein [Chitinophagales bacterium]MDW8428755.1 ROK family protein [Chitinophagales bacterium]